jgi:hypothetical protein
MKNNSVILNAGNSILRNPITGQSNPMLLLYLLRLRLPLRLRLRLCTLTSSHSSLSLLNKPYSLTTIFKLYEEAYSYACQRRHS